MLTRCCKPTYWGHSADSGWTPLIHLNISVPILINPPSLSSFSHFIRTGKITPVLEAVVCIVDCFFQEKRNADFYGVDPFGSEPWQRGA